MFSLWRIVKAMLEQKRLNQAVDAAMLRVTGERRWPAL